MIVLLLNLLEKRTEQKTSIVTSQLSGECLSVAVLLKFVNCLLVDISYIPHQSQSDPSNPS